jgi:predicted nuclease of predicted toxin-antitoxin system
MKLLFDQNLSHRLATTLADLYPGSKDVRNLGMKDASDSEVWDYAVTNGFTIASKDSDFHQRSLLLGCPPKVIWIRLGNCSTIAVAAILREHVHDIQEFEEDSEGTFLILS